MFGSSGMPELVIILVIALIIFGPRKLPEIGKSLGKMMGEFRRASNEFRSTIENEVEAEKIRDATRIEIPKLDMGLTASSPATVAPAAEASSAPAEAEAEPAAPAGGVLEPVATTVSRETTAAPIEPK